MIPPHARIQVRRYHGNPNKNMGDAFLLVWKENMEDSSGSPHDSDMTQITIPDGVPGDTESQGKASIAATLHSSFGKRSQMRRSDTARWSMADLRNHSVDSQNGDMSSVPQWMRQQSAATPDSRVARPSWSARDEEAIEFAEVQDGIDLKFSTSRANDAIKAMVQVVYHLQHLNSCSGERLLAEIRKLGFHQREDELYRKKKEQQMKAMIEMLRSELAPLDDDGGNADANAYHEISMGFGLHYGWAVEGAIGSSIKIDASYLSPHVNIASRLEAATKQYEVPLLLSGEIYELLSISVQQRCRKLDSVTVKGSKDPVDLYTWDFLPMCDEHCGGGKEPVQGAADRFYVSPGFNMLEDLEVGFRVQCSLAPRFPCVLTIFGACSLSFCCPICHISRMHRRSKNTGDAFRTGWSFTLEGIGKTLPTFSTNARLNCHRTNRRRCCSSTWRASTITARKTGLDFAN